MAGRSVLEVQSKSVICSDGALEVTELSKFSGDDFFEMSRRKHDREVGGVERR